MRRCHELRQKPIDDFTVEDLRLMIGQGIGLSHLIPLALGRLRADLFAEGDYFPGDLLSNVLRVERAFWQDNPRLASDLSDALRALPNDIPNEQRVGRQLRADIEAFRSSSPEPRRRR
jgi:hypothetical protein